MKTRELILDKKGLTIEDYRELYSDLVERLEVEQQKPIPMRILNISTLNRVLFSCKKGNMTCSKR